MENKLGEKIKEIRIESGLNQEEFAKELGYTSRSTINKIEKGVNEISYEKLELLIRKFNVKVDELFDDLVISSGGISLNEENLRSIKVPDANYRYPKAGINNMINIKPTITNPNIIVGDFSYYAGKDFETRVKHHYDFLGDKLIIGKFCQIGANVNIIMNGANHQMNAVTTFPFYVMDGWKEDAPSINDLPYKGDTVIGNDVWIGENVTILPGVHIGNGVIVGAGSVVSKDLPSYSVCAGNSCAIKKMRYDDEMIKILEELKWWDKSIDEIQKIIPIITKANITKEELLNYLK